MTMDYERGIYQDGPEKPFTDCIYMIQLTVSEKGDVRTAMTAQLGDMPLAEIGECNLGPIWPAIKSYVQDALEDYYGADEVS